MPKIVPVVAPQPTMKIRRETFRATSDPRPMSRGLASVTDGVVIVEYADATIEAPAALWDRGSLFVYGFVARYRTGKKIWRVRVSQLGPEEEIHISFGCSDRGAGRRKHGSIWFAPKLWPNACE